MGPETDRRKRPISVTILAVAVIVWGLVTLATKIFVVASPEAYAMFREAYTAMNDGALVKLPMAVHLGHGFLSSPVLVVAGAFMLAAKNWARLLLVAWPLTALALTIAVGGLALPFYLKAATYLVVLYLLMRKNCRDYFRPAAPRDPAAA